MVGDSAEAEAEAAIREIGGILLSLAPPDWILIEFEAVKIGTVGRQDMWVTMKGGERVFNTPNLSFKAARAVKRLKRASYKDEVGTWLSMSMSIEENLSFRVKYNYDAPPPEDLPVPDGSYVLEMSFFPRKRENIPVWMLEKLENYAGGAL